jgi:hypothetical protein
MAAVFITNMRPPPLLMYMPLCYYRRSRCISERNDRLPTPPCSNFKSESEKQQNNAAKKKKRSASSNTERGRRVVKNTCPSDALNAFTDLR